MTKFLSAIYVNAVIKYNQNPQALTTFVVVCDFGADRHSITTLVTRDHVTRMGPTDWSPWRQTVECRGALYQYSRQREKHAGLVREEVVSSWIALNRV